jgi:hypothetical protein
VFYTQKVLILKVYPFSGHGLCRIPSRKLLGTGSMGCFIQYQCCVSRNYITVVLMLFLMFYSAKDSSIMACRRNNKEEKRKRNKLYARKFQSKVVTI